MGQNLFSHIEILASEKDEQYYIQDEEGNLSPIAPGKIGKVILKSNKSDLYDLIFSKTRIGLEEIKDLESVDFVSLKGTLISLIYENLNYKLKKEAKSEIADIIKKYNLKEINERSKK